jgi:hypothetical protein
MQLFLKCNKKFKVLSCVLLASILLVTNSTSVLAGPTNLSFYMPNGGSWEYNGKTDTDITQHWSTADWMSVTVVQNVIFLSPDTVKNKLYKLASELGISMTNEYIKTGLELAASYGIEQAKKKLVEKLGSSIAGKVIPYLSAISWAYTAYDLLDTMSAGEELTRLTNAVVNNTGIIYVKQRGLGDESTWYYWDGSSKYGTYPNVKLNPNNWQYGNVTIN